MKTINFVKSFTSLREAIENSNQAFGLNYYAPSEFARKLRILSDVKRFFLTEDKEIIYFYPSQTSMIVNKFGWGGCLHNGAAALVDLIRKPDLNEKILKADPSLTSEEAIEWMENPIGILVHEYQWNRDSLRNTHLYWTVDSF